MSVPVNSELIDNLNTKLAQLGDTAFRVHKSLQDLELEGIPLDDNKCPIAAFVKQFLALPSVQYVSVQHCELNIHEHFGGPILYTIPLPKGIIKFISEYDSGKYRTKETEDGRSSD